MFKIDKIILNTRLGRVNTSLENLKIHGLYKENVHKLCFSDDGLMPEWFTPPAPSYFAQFYLFF